MKNSRKIITMLIIGLFSSTSFFASGWSVKSQVTHLNTYRNIVLVKVPTAAYTNPDNCSTTDNYYSLPLDHPLFKEVYATLLSAKVSKSEVSFMLSGCTGGTGSIVGRPNISTVIIYD